jgi:hypothetical protein
VHPIFEPSCGVCQSLSGDCREPALYEDDLWVVRPASPPGVPGWMMMISAAYQRARADEPPPT